MSTIKGKPTNLAELNVGHKPLEIHIKENLHTDLCETGYALPYGSLSGMWVVTLLAIALALADAFAFLQGPCDLP